jgi:hypothetical protein
MESTIRVETNTTTLVNVFTVEPENQQKLVDVLKGGTDEFGIWCALGDLIRFTLRDFVVELLPRPSSAAKSRHKKSRKVRDAQSTGGRSEACALESLKRLNRFEIDLTVRKPDGRIAYSFKGRLIDKLAWQTVPGDKVPSSCRTGGDHRSEDGRIV